MIYKIILILFFIIFASYSRGHGLGQTIEKIAGDYMIDIDLNAKDKILAEEPVIYNFRLWNKDRTEAIDFDKVWVRIVPQEEGIVFASYLALPIFGAPGMTYTFPEEGDYVLTLRFIKDDKTLSESDFNIKAESNSSWKNLFSLGKIIAFGAGVFIFLLGNKFISRSKG